MLEDYFQKEKSAFSKGPIRLIVILHELWGRLLRGRGVIGGEKEGGGYHRLWNVNEFSSNAASHEQLITGEHV